MENYYEKAFFKLVEQIDMELGFAEETLENEEKSNDEYFILSNTMGMIFAYKSIKELADKLKNKEYEFEDDEFVVDD